MNVRYTFSALLCACGIAAPVLWAADSKPAGEEAHFLSTKDLHSIVSYLASDELEGRLAGSRGAELAAEFIAAQMKRIGLQPVGTNNGFFQSYQFNSGARVRTNANHLSLASTAGTTEFEVEKDFRPLAFTANAEVEG